MPQYGMTFAISGSMYKNSKPGDIAIKNNRTRDFYRSGLFDGGLPAIVYPNVALICIPNYEDRRKAVAFTRSMLDAGY